MELYGAFKGGGVSKVEESTSGGDWLEGHTAQNSQHLEGGQKDGS